MNIRKLFTTKYNDGLVNVWLLVFRIVAAAFMLTHGLPKFQMLISGQEIMFPDPIGLGSQVSFMLIVFAEFFCSIFIIVGFGTRFSAIPLTIAMAVAAFAVHAKDPFATKELAFVYLAIFIGFIFTGAGKYSVDYLIAGKNSVKKAKSKS
jgi:putative oxidoreductase